MAPEGRRFEIQGTVQGVGFRPWVFRLATTLGLTGWVRNDAAGVTIEAFGTAADLAAFEAELHRSAPPAARIEARRTTRIAAQDHAAFVIVPSQPGEDRRVSIPADLATCDACLADIRNPANRRFRYPFTNCTNCGPRFTIARGVPYDRPATTMAAFEMCEACQAEYDDPTDRRFHAQPNACPLCGPRVWLTDPDGRRLESADPLADAARDLQAGRIVALKGLGGFHLACDATSAASIAALRQRKRRDEKPFAVMVASLAAAESLARLTDADRALLQSVERPIVIVDRRPGAPLHDLVAPRNPTIGLMLPYTPLHHLLLADAARPLVMTSGNVSDEPIAYRNGEALARLGSIADVFVLHNREIDTRCDDSVARVVAGAPIVFRRSRGYTPRAVRVRQPYARPTLGCGALLKNTFCLGVGDAAFLGPHVGDLENLETYEAFTHAVERMETFVGVTAEVLAHDLHPEYLSTTYASRRGGATVIGVQHHHAHIASAMAERGLEGPVIGVAYDGTGFGTDGTAWGGEILLADFASFTRLATFRALPLAGGNLAIRHVWRQALACVLDAFGDDAPLDRIPVLNLVPGPERDTVGRMLAQRVNTPLARGVGRYFDAAGALGLARTEARYEGQLALEWNLAADASERSAYPVARQVEAGLDTIDLRPAFRALVLDVLASVPAGVMSARFHNTLIEATADVVRESLTRHGTIPIVLSGGCFQNARLAEGIVAALGSTVQVVLHESVPPGDGGLALGQAAVANAHLLAGGPAPAEASCA